MPPDNDTIRAMAQRAGQLVQHASQHQYMAPGDQWLYSVWYSDPDWSLLDQILTDRAPETLSIPLLIGCLHLHRRGSDDRQAILLERAGLLAYESATEKISQGRVGILTGGTGPLHYLLRAGTYSEKASLHLNRLVRQTIERVTRNSQAGGDLSLQAGRTGLMLTLIESAWLVKDGRRIDVTVTEIKAIISEYIQYLLVHQIPIDSQPDNWSVFPDSVDGPEWSVTGHLSWARGDLGQLLLLYQAGRLLDRPDIVRWADRLSGYVLQRRIINRVQVDSPGLVDGMAGLCLLYRRLYRLTGRHDFYREGEFWLQRFLTDIQADHPPMDWSFLTGMLGISGAIRQWLADDHSLDLLFL